MLSEFEHCINAIYDMETEKRYQNVKLLVNEPFCFENDKEPKFLNAVFNCDTQYEDEEYINELSFIFLRSDNGFFNKVRFSVTTENASDEVLEKMEAFLIDWLSYVSVLGDTIN